MGIKADDELAVLHLARKLQTDLRLAVLAQNDVREAGITVRDEGIAVEGIGIAEGVLTDHAAEVVGLEL